MFSITRSGYGAAQVSSRRLAGSAKLGCLQIQNLTVPSGFVVGPHRISSRCAPTAARAATATATNRLLCGDLFPAGGTTSPRRQNQRPRHPHHQRTRCSSSGGGQVSASLLPAGRPRRPAPTPAPGLASGGGSLRPPPACPRGTSNVVGRGASFSSTATVQEEKAAPAASFPTVSSRVSPATATEEASIARMCQEGEWEHACKMLGSIRDDGRALSMAAHMDVIGVCRRAMKWHEALKTYSDMVQTYLPANLFEEMACDNFEDESNHPFQRACGLVVKMQGMGVKPNNDTYRALLQFCKDDGGWEAAILLLEQARRAKVKFNLFCFDLVIATMVDQGRTEVGTMLYELRVVEADRSFLETEDNATPAATTNSGKDGQGPIVIPWPTWPLKVGPNGGAILELHDLPLSIALVTVEVALLDVMRRPEGRAHWSGVKWLRIITGMGNNSKDKEAVIKPAVAEMLESKGLKPEFQQHNEGCIELKPANLEAYAQRIQSHGAAAGHGG